MKSSKGDKPKSPKPKPQFQGIPPAVSNTDDEKPHSTNQRLRPGTPKPFIPVKVQDRMVKESHQPAPSSGQHNNHAASESSQLKNDLWERMKTIDSPQLAKPPPKSDKPPPYPRNKTLKHHQPAKPEVKVVPQVLEESGHAISLTDLLTRSVPGQSTKHYVIDNVSTSSSAENFPNAPITLAVQDGIVFIPTHLRPSPENNSFANTHDLGPPQAQRRWLIDMGNFRDSEITFTLDGNTLKIVGNQHGKVTIKEAISLQMHFQIENFRVYRNTQIGTLIVSYLPHY